MYHHCGKPQSNLTPIIFTIKICTQIYISKNTDKLWHERLGHIGKSKFVEMKRNNLLSDIHLLDKVYPIQ